MQANSLLVTVNLRLLISIVYMVSSSCFLEETHAPDGVGLPEWAIKKATNLFRCHLFTRYCGLLTWMLRKHQSLSLGTLLMAATIIINRYTTKKKKHPKCGDY